MMLFLEEVETR
jgi:hypothetical protein